MRCPLLALLLLSGAALDAQWLNYPTAGVPRTPSGLANLGAPTPRTADGQPDLSGMWEAVADRPCPPDGCADMHIGKQFMDIGAGLPGGLPYQPWAAALVKSRMADDGKDDQTTRCLPIGVPRLHVSPFLRKYVQLPGLLIILNEQGANFRQIFTDGRSLPDDPQPTWAGYSVGKWEGDTLVVETAGLRDGLWLDRNGSPLTDAAKVTERFHRVNYGNMEIEVTVNDPKAYTKPWTVKFHQFIVLNTDFLEDACNENEKDLPHLNRN